MYQCFFLLHPYSDEIFVYKHALRPILIWNHHKHLSYIFLLHLNTYRLWVCDYYKYINSVSAGTVLRRQNQVLTSQDGPRSQRINSTCNRRVIIPRIINVFTEKNNMFCHKSQPHFVPSATDADVTHSKMDRLLNSHPWEISVVFSINVIMVISQSTQLE